MFCLIVSVPLPPASPTSRPGLQLRCQQTAEAADCRAGKQKQVRMALIRIVLGKTFAERKASSLVFNLLYHSNRIVFPARSLRGVAGSLSRQLRRPQLPCPPSPGSRLIADLLKIIFPGAEPPCSAVLPSASPATLSQRDEPSRWSGGMEWLLRWSERAGRPGWETAREE